MQINQIKIGFLLEDSKLSSKMWSSYEHHLCVSYSIVQEWFQNTPVLLVLLCTMVNSLSYCNTA